MIIKNMYKINENRIMGINLATLNSHTDKLKVYTKFTNIVTDEEVKLY